MYAIKNIITQQWVYGTDFRYNPHHQRISDRQALTWENEVEANLQFKHRQCGKDYKVVEVEFNEI
jgi:hypothetical protein